MKGLKILICEDEFLPATDLKKQLTALGQLELIEQIVENKPVPFLIKPFDIYMVHVGLQLAVYQAKLEKKVGQLQIEVRNLEAKSSN